MTPSAVRTDTLLIKHLNATIGAKAVQVYNRLPFFLMPEESDEILRHERDLIEAAPDVLLLPFNDFILDFPFGTEVLTRTVGEGYARGACG